ncbi:hypothetical protein N7455_001153 [Penicillium solitum]|uniref:uncharacterized protein n=1 Tax=Penicillium solitum TaxID=60172 RepID=UPI0032C47D69|nr:hypothetical protein N7455_001153 [Penicillium solitum]
MLTSVTWNEMQSMRIHSNCISESHEYIRSRPHPSSLFSPTSLQPTQLSKASPATTDAAAAPLASALPALASALYVVSPPLMTSG